MAFVIFTVLLFTSCGAVGFMGVVMAKGLDQRRRDQDLQSYRLAFPQDLDADQVLAWVRSISGARRGAGLRLRGVPTIVFELWSTPEGIQHRMRIPWQSAADYIIPQLRLKGVRVDLDDDPPYVKWTRVLDVGMKHASRTLAIYEPVDTAHSILASVASPQEGETVLLQLIVSPTSRQKLPIHTEARSDSISLRTLASGNLASRDEIRERREKLSEPNLLGAMRIGAVAKTEVRADHLIRRVQKALISTQGPATRYVRRPGLQRELKAKLSTASTPVVSFPMQFSAPELAALIAWPIRSPNVAGLPPMMARHVQPTKLVPEDGLRLGRSNLPGAERDVAVSFADSSMHMHIMGSTGSGKTTLIENLGAQIMRKDYGLIAIDPKGDLFYKLLDHIPPDRIKQTIIMDMADATAPVGLNMLDQGDPLNVIDEITALIDYLSQGTGGSLWLKKVSYHGLRTLLAQPGSSLIDLPALLVPNASERVWADELKRSVPDPEIREFWQEMDNLTQAQRDNVVRPVLDRYWQLTNRPIIRNVIGQSKSTFKLSEVLDKQQILLINLARLPSDTADLFGSMVYRLLWDNVKQHPHPDAPTYMLLDEFHRFVDLPMNMEETFVMARSMGFPNILAHQNLDQLPNKLEAVIHANTMTKVVFKTSAKDAKVMSTELGGALTDKDMQSLGGFEAAARVGVPGGSSPAFTMATVPPMKGTGNAGRVRNVSRQQFGRPVAEVEHEIRSRRHKDGPSGSSPLMAGDGWGDL